MLLAKKTKRRLWLCNMEKVTQLELISELQYKRDIIAA